MAEPNESKDNRKDGGKPKPTFSPFSPFPYGSPLAQGLLQTSFTGSPGQKILLGESVNHSRTNGEVVTPRLKGQDLYGGKATKCIVKDSPLHIFFLIRTSYVWWSWFIKKNKITIG